MNANEQKYYNETLPRIISIENELNKISQEVKKENLKTLKFKKEGEEYKDIIYIQVETSNDYNIMIHESQGDSRPILTITDKKSKENKTIFSKEIINLLNKIDKRIKELK